MATIKWQQIGAVAQQLGIDAAALQERMLTKTLWSGRKTKNCKNMEIKE